jgi:rubrerythrin
MPLENFGSILNFAEQLEKEDREFYSILVRTPACAENKALFESLAADAKKNIQTIERTRRENVTEMILEPVKDFTRDPFCVACQGAENLSAAEALDTAKRLEERALRYYTAAAEKIKAQQEVARALKAIGKKRKARIEKLADL